MGRSREVRGRINKLIYTYFSILRFSTRVFKVEITTNSFFKFQFKTFMLHNINPNFKIDKFPPITIGKKRISRLRNQGGHRSYLSIDTKRERIIQKATLEGKSLRNAARDFDPGDFVSFEIDNPAEERRKSP